MSVRPDYIGSNRAILTVFTAISLDLVKYEYVGHSHRHHQTKKTFNTTAICSSYLCPTTSSLNTFLQIPSYYCVFFFFNNHTHPPGYLDTNPKSSMLDSSFGFMTHHFSCYQIFSSCHERVPHTFRLQNNTFPTCFLCMFYFSIFLQFFYDCPLILVSKVL